jgi:hypothetical protein
MDPKGKGMVVNDKEKESLFNEPRDDKPTDSGSSTRRGTGRRRGASRRLRLGIRVIWVIRFGLFGFYKNWVL